MNVNHPHHPPRLAQKLFSWFSATAAVEDLQGDLDEQFVLNLKRMSPTRASWVYWKHTISLLVSYALRQRKGKEHHSPFASSAFSAAMLRNYFLTASRNLARHRFFTILNVLGLAIGMSIGLLFIAMISFLWKYDTFHSQRDRIHRVITQVHESTGSDEYASAPTALYEKLQQETEGIDAMVRIRSGFGGNARFNDQEVPLQGYLVDPTFLTVFSFPLVKGNSATALAKPYTILITEKAAQKMFGDEDPFGKIISLGEWGDCEITGVLQDLPKNSHLQFEILGSFATWTIRQQKVAESPASDWREFQNNYLYLLLNDKKFAEGLDQYLTGISSTMPRGEEDFKARFYLQSLNDIVPGPHLSNEVGMSWDYPSMMIFLVLTLLILIPACFNYATISVSRSLRRMKEIGLRKVLGGEARQVFVQFIMETVIITLIALVLSFYIFTIIRQEFLNMLIGGVEGMSLTPDMLTVMYFVLFAFLVALAAGAVPALYFSRLNPIQALKSKTSGRTRSAFSVRKALLVAQFALSLGFIMSVVIALNQYRETLNYSFGFNRENILDVALQDADPTLFANEYSRLASVRSLSLSSHVVGTGFIPSVWVREADAIDSVEVFQMFVDENYIKNLGIAWITGKNFAGQSDKRHVIVNEEFVRQFGFSGPSEALSQAFTLPDGEEVVVIGIVKNFHYTSLREPIRSFFFRYDPNEFRIANLNVQTEDVFSSLTEMEATWKTLGSNEKFKAKFFDDELEEAYSFHFSIVKICGFLGLLAISIASLGLLGMVVFTVENRVKEIGIRKVMGATTGSITMLLSRDFAKLMALAAPIAIPLTYLFFEKVYFRTQFYKIPIGVMEIVLSLVLLLAIGLATILSQTLRAARANPADALRTE